MQKLSSPIELIKKSLGIFFDKDNFIYFLKIYAFLLPFSVITLIEDNYLNLQTKNLNLSDPSQLFGQNPWLIWVYFIVGIGFVLASFWVSASGIMAVDGIISNKTEGVKKVFTESWKRLWPFSLLLIVLGIMTSLGFVLLIVPGILVLVWYNFAGYELLTKKVRIKEAMANSKKLVAGRFWQVFGRILVFGIFMVLFQIIFSVLPFNIGPVVSSLFGAVLVLPYFLLYKELSG